MDAMNPPLERTAAPWHRLRVPLGIFGASLLLGGLLAGTTGWMRSADEDLRLAASQAHDRALVMLAQAQIDRQARSQYEGAYTRLRERGWLGPGQRLAWIEALQSSQAKRGIVALQFDIDIQQSLDLPATLAPAGTRLLASRMVLHLGLPHEGALFGLFDDLRATGMLAGQDCKMHRLPVVPDAPAAARLQADCTLLWLNLQEAP